MPQSIEARRAARVKCSHSASLHLHTRVIDLLGGRCANPACQWLNADGSRGCTDYRCLQIDHVNGEGAEDRRTARKGTMFYRFVIKNILSGVVGRYQVLCANCNWIKRHANREYNRVGYGARKEKS